MNIDLYNGLYSIEKILIRDIIFLKVAPCDIYSFRKPWEPLINKGDLINKEIILKFIEKKEIDFFVKQNDKYIFQDSVHSLIIETLKKFSLGNPLENGKKILHLLSLTQRWCYKDPFNEKTLKSHFNFLKIFTEVLVNHIKICPALFKEYQKMGFHYLTAQPILSTLFFSSLIVSSKIFDKQFNGQLIMTSFLKDIGMTLVDESILKKKKIEKESKKALDQHASFSKIICQKHLPLSNTQLNLIEHHHDIKNEQIIFGPELLFLNFSDILSAMISNRPYRTKNSLYKSLEYIKFITPKNKNQEYKLLVNFSASFFKA